ncbi:uncharacterized protein LOC131943205 [Physella acuta]|uniref:uncharacterized protein LOC131943205 n=1 Tax=Physella acuta TaxID=109671 RepID=UPI0027DC86F8|nr:uncharacterized protein LOC131943205 [Physella acuta]
MLQCKSRLRQARELRLRSSACEVDVRNICVQSLRNRNMAAPVSIDAAAGAGDFSLVQQLLERGEDPNKKSRDGMTPLAIASFWGYDNIVGLLIQNGADINASNSGTLWTPLHCASFQGHGKVIMTLMEHNPDLFKQDSSGRTAVDFASALDSIWAFFAAAGCSRTPKADLIQKNIIKKVETGDPQNPVPYLKTLSRPGSAYVFNENFANDKVDDKVIAFKMGDVLARTDDNHTQQYNRNITTVWNY